ncbi:MAG: glutathione S-transferase N-terminal domain-containing protein, partial [Gemmatimonadetes bacterium]|nr:glutathione S-transferase N-terminal domain-containing protein [Gemmatimonadota bacterium]
MRLIQIPYSHNCVKVRRALELKGLPFDTEDIAPMDRSAPKRASGQALVPVLVDGERAIADSTAILLYLEERYPERPLLPAESRLRAECLLLEDWADAAFMALTRRLAYWAVLAQPGR